MERILKYVVLFGNLALIIGGQAYREISTDSHPAEKLQNHPRSGVNHYFLGDENDSFSPSRRTQQQQQQRQSTSDFRTRSNQMTKTPGLSHYLSEPQMPKLERKISPPRARNGRFNNRNRYRNSFPNKIIPPLSQKLIPTIIYRNPPPKNFFGRNAPLKGGNLKLIPIRDRNNSFAHQPVAQGSRSHHQIFSNGGRNPRFYPPRKNSKFCDACNSIPWIPLINVPDSYRKERTQKFEPHKPESANVNWHYQPLLSSTKEFSTSPNPLVPSTPIPLDGTISNSFGLPVGNIPTDHGLLAPINHFVPKFNRHEASGSSDFGHPLTNFPSPTFLDGSPELRSPVLPTVPPLFSPDNFYPTQTLLGASQIGLPPPKTNTLSVSNVFLTISEENSHDLKPPQLDLDSVKFFSNANENFNLKQSSNGDIHNLEKPQRDVHNQNHQSFDGIDVVKSVPVAEFSTGGQQFHQPEESNGKFHFQNGVDLSSHKNQITLDNNPSAYLNPPPEQLSLSRPEVYNPTESPEKSHFQTSSPKPLTNSWLFLDDEPEPKASKVLADPPAGKSRETSSAFNGEIGSASSQSVSVVRPSSGSQNSENSKTKRVQIIVPYTIKSENDLDVKGSGSDRFEVFRALANSSSNDSSPERHFTTTASLISEEKFSRDKAEGNGKPSQGNVDYKAGQASIKSDGEKIKNKKSSGEVHHVLAKNLKEVLMREIEKNQGNQNYPLQNNIDNWTALEYSNHKFGAIRKRPKEILKQALSVTSVPKNPISQLLLPSKKIPENYFVTTPVPDLQETLDSLFRRTPNFSVDGRPFASSLSSTTTGHNFFATVTEKTATSSTAFLQISNNESRTEPNPLETVSAKSRVNYFSGKPNENSVLSEIKSSTKSLSETSIESIRGNISSSRTEKLQFVTPVSVTTKRKRIVTTRRTTSHARATEKIIFRKFTKRPNIGSTTISPLKVGNKSTLLKLLNSPRWKKNSNSSRDNKIPQSITNGKKKLAEASTTPRTPGVEKVQNNQSDFVISQEPPKNVSAGKIDSKSEGSSISDIFPFRNEGLPWERQQNETHRPNNDRRKNGLIKEVKLPRPTRFVDSLPSE